MAVQSFNAAGFYSTEEQRTTVNDLTVSRLVLGTVQLGIPYGIANMSGRPDTETAREIVSAAFQEGVRYFDTAQAYGDSETVLGESFRFLGISDRVNVVSKLPPQFDLSDAAVITGLVRGSMKRLGVRQLYGLMLHREEQLDQWNNGLGRALAELKDNGLVCRIGVSCYSSARALLALDTPGISILQIPANLFDRRFENAGIARKAEVKDCEVHIRSVFLQGLLLMQPADLSAAMEFARPTLDSFCNLCREERISQQEAALHYVRRRWQTARIIFGAENPEQVKSNIACWKKRENMTAENIFEERFTDVDEKIIFPNRWPQ